METTQAVQTAPNAKIVLQAKRAPPVNKRAGVLQVSTPPAIRVSTALLVNSKARLGTLSAWIVHGNKIAVLGHQSVYLSAGLVNMLAGAPAWIVQSANTRLWMGTVHVAIAHPENTATLPHLSASPARQESTTTGTPSRLANTAARQESTATTKATQLDLSASRVRQESTTTGSPGRLAGTLVRQESTATTKVTRA